MRIRRTDGSNTDNVIPIRSNGSSSTDGSKEVNQQAVMQGLGAVRGGRTRHNHSDDLFRIREIREALTHLLCIALADCPDPRVEGLRNLVRNS